jgi:hypothetical protein
MTLVRNADDVTDQLEKVTTKYRSHDELNIRKAPEGWGRRKYPEARQVHELVVGRGTSRCDVAFVEPANLIGVEIKSGYDHTTRLFDQSAIFSLAMPEVWICCDTWHLIDVEIVRYAVPHIGLLEAKRDMNHYGMFHIKEIEAPKRREPHPRMALGLLWVNQLWAEAGRRRLIQGKSRPTHAYLVGILREKLSPDEIMTAVCRQLLGRDAFWRADPPRAV